MMAALSYDEVKAIACGNPAVREKATLDAEIMALQLKRRLHDDMNWDARTQLKSIPDRVRASERNADLFTRWDASLKAGTENGLEFVVNGRKFTDQDKIQQILTLAIAECNEQNAPGSRRDSRVSDLDLGVLCGTLISFNADRFCSGAFNIFASFEHESIKLGSYSTGASVVKKVQALLTELPEMAAKSKSSASYWRDQEPILIARAGGDFPDEALLRAKIARSREIATEMGLLKDMAGTEAVDENSEVKSALAADVLETSGVVEVEDPLDCEETPEETLAVLS
jgi:hypothetical protein